MDFTELGLKFVCIDYIIKVILLMKIYCELKRS